MALVACNDCGHMISSRARSCPKCGAAVHPAPTHPAAARYAAQKDAAFAAAEWGGAIPASPIDSFGTFEKCDEPKREPRKLSLPKVSLPPFSKLLALFKIRRSGEADTADAVPHPPAEPPTSKEWHTSGEPQLFAASPLQESVELPTDVQAQEVPDEEVFYLTGEGRNGPVPLSYLYRIVSDGELDLDTPVCAKGESQWLSFTEYLLAREKKRTAAAGRGRADGAPSAVPWVAALAPLWSGMLPLLATQLWIYLGYKPLPYQAHLWWSVPVLASAACYLDYRGRKKKGLPVSRIDLWLCLIIPLYLYRRVKTALALIVTCFFWCASCLVTLAGFVLVNGYNAPVLTVVERMIHAQRYLP